MLPDTTPPGNPALAALARIRALRAKCEELEAAQRRDEPDPPDRSAEPTPPRLGRRRTRPVDAPPLTGVHLGEAALVDGLGAGFEAAHAARMVLARALLAGLAVSDAALDAFARRTTIRLVGARALAAQTDAACSRHVAPPAVATRTGTTVPGRDAGVNIATVADDRARLGGPAATPVTGVPSAPATPDASPRTGPATPESPVEVPRPGDGLVAPGGSAQGGRHVRPARCILLFAPDAGHLPATAPPGPASVPVSPGGATSSAGGVVGDDGPGAQEKAAPFGVARLVVTSRAPDRPPVVGGGPRADTLRRAPSRPRPRPRAGGAARRHPAWGAGPPRTCRGPPARAGPS